MNNIFGLITTIEDKSFFIRQKSYSWCSLEFIKYRFSRLRNEKKGKSEEYHRRIDFLFLLKHPRTTLIKCYKVLCQGFESIKCFIVKIKKMRGFSTLEMQYIRTIGVETGKDEFKFRRKIFEIIYTKIFFCSVRNYYKRNKYTKEKNFKEYMLYQYMQVVFTKINGIPFEHLAEAFESSNMAEWDIDSVAVAVLGMNGNGIYTERLELYEGIFEQYGVDSERVLELANEIKNRKIEK